MEMSRNAKPSTSSQEASLNSIELNDNEYTSLKTKTSVKHTDSNSGNKKKIGGLFSRLACLCCKKEVVSDTDGLEIKDVEDMSPLLDVNKRHHRSGQQTEKRESEIEKPMENFQEIKDEATSKSEVDTLRENNVKEQVQDATFNKREGTGGIGGQLYEIYLVLLFLLHGLTNENITRFHLASNLKEAGDFDDVVFSYSYKDVNGAEKFKVTFLQAKHKEKTKNISLEELLGKTGKGAFDLKKYFRSFCDIKKKFKTGKPTHPIFGSNFDECEFILYTNAIFKYGFTEKVYINELFTEDNSVLNFTGGSNNYIQLCLSGMKDDRIKNLIPNASESELQEFQEFLSKLKICSAQPNQNHLKEFIKQKIQSYYGVPTSDIETVFGAVKNKIEEWWKDSSKYLTEKNTYIQDIVRVSIRFEIQDPVPTFTGRQQTLQDLHEALQSGGESVISQSASVTGLGGIGKTELARKYVSEYGQFYDDNIIWINAETYATCSESFRRLARDALEINIKNKGGEEKDISFILSEVYAFFAKRGRKSLFIFDNAETPQVGGEKEDENVKTFLPTGKNKPFVLITSRNQEWSGIKSLQLDLFTEEESMQFIIKSLGGRSIELNESEVKNLGVKLQLLPLALRQAVAYIAMENKKLKKWNKKYTIGNYLKEFEEKELLGIAPQDIFDNYSKTILTTWQVTIEKIRKNEKYGNSALLILNVIAYLDPDSIPILIIFADRLDKGVIVGCADLLEKYSMVKLQNGEISIHRLLQHVIRIQLKQEKKEEEVVETILTMFNDSDISLNCIDHARSVWDYANNCNEIVTKFYKLPQKIMVSLNHAIRYNEAYLFGVRTHKFLKDMLGDDHPDTLYTLNWIAYIQYMQGKHNEAVGVFQEVLCKERKILGPSHPVTLETMYALAEVLKVQGKHKDSLRLYQDIFSKGNKISEQDHLKTLVTMQSLASIHCSEGKFAESLDIYQEIFRMQNETLEPNDPSLFITMEKLASVFQNQKKFKESERLYQELVYKKEIIFGPDHPEIIRINSFLADVLRKQGKYEKSLKLYQKVLYKEKKMLGKDHPDTLMTMHFIAEVNKDLGYYDKSLKLYKEVLCKQTEILGPKHYDTLVTMQNLASIMFRQQKYEESLSICKEVLCKRKEQFGSDHPDTLMAMQILASVFDVIGKYDESLKLYQEVYRKQNEHLRPDHSHTLTTINNLTKVLHKMGNYKEYLSLYEELLCKKQEILGPGHPDTVKSIEIFFILLG